MFFRASHVFWCLAVGLDRPSIVLSVVLLLCVGNTFSQKTFAQTSPKQQAAGQILVLKNGEMLRGVIEQDGLKLVVHTRQGSRLVIPKTSAEFICDSTTEAFWGKSARVRASDSQGQVDLFRWCLRHRLLGHAETQIDVLMQCDISPADLVALHSQFTATLEAQRRLALNQQRLASEAADDLATDRGKPSTTIFESLPVLAATDAPPPAGSPKFDGNVAPASFLSPVTDGPATISGNDASAILPAATKFSTAGPIPDLSTGRARVVTPSNHIDPYDATSFNRETDRLRSK